MSAMDNALQEVLGTVAADEAMWSDFLALCDCGGRRAGTPSEERGIALVCERLAKIGSEVSVARVPYAAWRLDRASLDLDGVPLACNPLLGSQSTPAAGVAGEVCDVGRGAPADFERHAAAVAGRFVVVRHEYPFSTETVHRRRKLAMAMDKGAAGFIIANPFPGAGAVAGSSGRGGAAGIPAVGTDYESSVRLAAASGSHARVRVVVAAEDYAGETSALILDLPGRTREWVVLSAHVDGHDLAESAMDNATGVAAALAIARAVAPRIAECERGLRVCIFSAEEWALAGSRQYLDTMPDEERARIAFNVNLDTLGGDERFTALTSDFPKLDAYVQTVAGESGLALGTYLPIMSNSDHYNFARHGVPALRIVAGFNRPDSDIRLILTRGDTRDRVKPAQLAEGARIAATLAWRALTAKSEDLRNLRE